MAKIESTDSFTSGTVPITGHGGAEIPAYLARPLTPAPRGGVVVLHHMPGLDRETKEITRRFAEEGYNAIVPHLHWHDAPGAAPDDAAAASRAAGGVPDERLLGDVAGAVAELRGLPAANGRIGVIGFCSGGRQAFLVAASLDVQAAVDCYGAFVTGKIPDDLGVAMSTLVHLAPELRCPLLGLFGAEDRYPSPADVDELDQALKAAGKDHEFHSYPGAGHAFFAVNRPAYNPAAALDGWDRIRAFFGAHL
ncbi:dienelactone hydrolase family protein [Actinocorallia lasiicapitis]